MDKDMDNIQKLNEYVEQMAYKVVEPPVASERTEALAQMRRRNIIGAYAEHKDVMEPKERAEYVGRFLTKNETITTEQLGDIIKQHRKKQAKSELDKKQQQIIYHDTLYRLQKKCGEQLMNAIVNKFAKEVSKRAITLPPANVETESYQRLQKSLVCNMYLALKISNKQQSQDYAIYTKLASVLAELILQALFLAQNTAVSTEKEIPPKDEPENSEKDRCIKLRALRAAKKKLYHRRQKCARFGGSVCSYFY